jgi:hypothetical protein
MLAILESAAATALAAAALQQQQQQQRSVARVDLNAVVERNALSFIGWE